MTLLGETEEDVAKSETSQSRQRTGVAKKGALGAGLGIGGGMMIGALSLLHSNPAEGFALLKSWGPKAFITIIVVYCVYDVLKIVLAMGLRAVIAMEKAALAQQRLVDKDDRQLQELQTLTSFAAQESERNSERVKELTAAQEKSGRTIDQVLEIVRQQQQPVDVRRVIEDTITAYKRAEAQGA